MNSIVITKSAHPFPRVALKCSNAQS